MNVNMSYLPILLSFVVISTLVCQFGLLFLGIYPFFLFQNTETMQDANPDIQLQLDVNSGIYSNSSSTLDIFNENVTQPSKALKSYVHHEMIGIYTILNINGTFTWASSETYWQSFLIGLDPITLLNLNSSLQVQLPNNDSEILLIQDRAHSTYHTDFQLYDEMEVFANPVANLSYSKKVLSISGLLEFEFPTENKLHNFPYFTPVDIFQKNSARGLLLITSLTNFHQIFDVLQNPPRVKYSLFRHIWLDRSLIDYNNLNPIFNIINDYVDVASQRSDFIYESLVVQSYNFDFESGILESLNSASAGFFGFLQIAFIFGVPLFFGAFLLAGFLMQLYEREKVGEYRLRKIRGFSIHSILRQSYWIYLITVFFGVLVGLVLAILLIFIYTNLYGNFANSLTFTQFKINWSVIPPILVFSLVLCFSYAIYRITRIYNYMKSSQNSNDKIINKKREKQGSIDLYFFLLGIIALIGEYAYQNNYLPTPLAILEIHQMLYFLNFVGFFGIFFGSLGIIKRIVQIIADYLPKLSKRFRNIFFYQMLITLRQRKHYIRLVQIMTFLILFIQLLLIYQHSITEIESQKALFQTGAEGFVNSPSLPRDVIEYFHISENTSIIRVIILCSEGYFTIFGIDPDSFFEITYNTQTFDEQLIAKLKTTENGAFFHKSLSEKAEDSILTLSYHNASYDVKQEQFSLISPFTSLPQIPRTVEWLYPPNILIIKYTELQGLLSQIHHADIEIIEEGSYVTVEDTQLESLAGVREFQGYHLEYYQDKINFLLLDLITTETFYFLMNGTLIAVISVITIFYFLTSFREKELSLEQVLGVSRKKQFLTIEISSLILLLICLGYGTFAGILASASLMNLYQLIETSRPPTVFIPLESVILVAVAFLIISVLSFPFKIGLYRGKDLFQTIRRM